MRKQDRSRNLLRNVTNTQLLVLSILFIAPGTTLAIALEAPSLFEKLLIAFITELGFALFIAWVIIITVDEREKSKAIDRHIEAERRLNSKMYLSQIIDLDLPKNVSEEIYKYIITSKLLKNEQIIDYHIVRCGNYIMLKQHYEATYINVGKEDYSFDMPLKIYGNSSLITDKLPNEKWGLQKSTCLMQRAGETVWSGIPTQPIVRGKADGEIEFPDKIILNPGDRIKVILDYNVPKYADDNEIFTNSQLSELTSVYIKYDKDEFDIGFRSIHARRDCYSEVDVENGVKIIFYYPFLPSNGFITWWRPKEGV